MPEDQMLRLTDVMAKTALSKATIYRMMARDEFPRQARLSHRVARWSARAVDTWVNETLKGVA